jgi:exopolysaccharide biosynthesis predicted pyruvyltransferase EpsI
MFFDLLPFNVDPQETLKTYADLDAVMSERFHGIIFGHITNIPTLALGAGNLKNRSLVEDYPRADLFISKTEADIEGQFEKLLAAIPT